MTSLAGAIAEIQQMVQPVQHARAVAVAVDDAKRLVPVLVAG